MLTGYLIRNKWLLTALAIYAGLILLNATGVSVWLPPCLVSHYTGHECLGCGLNRAAIALVQGHFRAAWAYNPLIFLYLPVIAAGLGVDFYKYSINYKHTIYE